MTQDQKLDFIDSTIEKLKIAEAPIQYNGNYYLCRYLTDYLSSSPRLSPNEICEKHFPEMYKGFKTTRRNKINGALTRFSHVWEGEKIAPRIRFLRILRKKIVLTIKD